MTSTADSSASPLLDMAFLHVAELLILVVFRLGARVVTGRHGEAVRQEIGQPKNDHDRGRQLGANDARHDGEGGDGAVDAAIDPVAQIADAGPVAEPFGDRAGRVTVLQPRQNLFPSNGLKDYGASLAWVGKGRKAA
jgi:hypothetical protein